MTMITIQKAVTNELRTPISMLQHTWFIHDRASGVKDEICLQNGCKQAWMYDTRKRNGKILWKKYLETLDVQLVTSVTQKNSTPPPLQTTHFSSRPLSKMPLGRGVGASARKHSIPMSTTDINQIIHVTRQYSTLIFCIHWTFLGQGAKYEQISHRTIKPTVYLVVAARCANACLVN